MDAVIERSHRPVLHPASGALPDPRHCADHHLVILAYIDHLGTLAATGRGSAATAEVRFRILRAWLRYLAEDRRRLTDQSGQAGQAGPDYLARLTTSAATRSMIARTIRACYHWAITTGRFQQANPFSGLTLPSTAANLPIRALHDQDLDRIIGRIPEDTLLGQRNRALLALLAICPVESIALQRATIGDRSADGVLLSLQARRTGTTTDLHLDTRAHRLLDAYLETRSRLTGQPFRPDAPLIATANGCPLSLVSFRCIARLAIDHANDPDPATSTDPARRSPPQLEPAEITAVTAPLRPGTRERTAALLHLAAAMPEGWTGWRHLTVGCWTPSGHLTWSSSGRRPRRQHVALLPAQAQSALAAWQRARRCCGASDDSPLFPTASGRPAEAWNLATSAWQLVHRSRDLRDGIRNPAIGSIRMGAALALPTDQPTPGAPRPRLLQLVRA